MQTIYLIRHATPDWSRTDIPYELPPGPPLTDLGQAEARALGYFLAQHRPGPWFSSPLERCLHTAEIASQQAGAPTIQVTAELAEIRPGEPESEVRVRLTHALEHALETINGGNIPLLFTHGGPVALLLESLGMNPGQVKSQQNLRSRQSPASGWSLASTAEKLKRSLAAGSGLPASSSISLK